jgi:hypothetical protein
MKVWRLALLLDVLQEYQIAHPELHLEGLITRVRSELEDENDRS